MMSKNAGVAKNRGREKRLLLISEYYTQNLVGTQRLRHLVKYLGKRGLSTVVVDRDMGKGKLAFLIKIIYSIVSFRGRSVFISCGPFYYSTFAVLAARLRGKNTILDYRDPWSPNLSVFGNALTKPLKRVRNRLVLFLERIGYKCANWFIVCTPGMHGLYRRLFGSDEKLRLLPNGYDFDPETIAGGTRVDDGVDRYICLGKFLYYSREKAARIMSAIEGRSARLDRKAMITFAGSEGAAVVAFASRIVSPERVEIRCLDRLPYEESLSLVASADCGVLISRNEDFDFGTKVFDYIGCGIPILDCFDHDKLFYKTFRKYIVSANERYLHYFPDLKWHRDVAWSENIDIFLV